MEKKGGRISLAVKLNALIAAAIIITTVGLILASGNTYTLTIERVFSKESDKVLDRVTLHMDPEEIDNLREAIDTPEFETVREEAESKDDGRIIQTWLRRKPSHFADERHYDSDFPVETLYSDYLELYSYLTYAIRFSTSERLFLFYEKDGQKHILADANMTVLGIGTVDYSGPDLDEYTYDEISRGVIYEENGAWLFCKGAEMFREENGEQIPVCVAAVIYDVDYIVRGRSQFVLYTILIAIVLTAIVILITFLLLRRTVVAPLKQLADGAVAFGKGEGVLTKDDVISMDFRADDEIGDLYTEIRSMQERIVDYTNNLATATAEKERVGTELRMAAHIQETMLPHNQAELSERPEFDLAASMEPAKEVGGDFYDYFMIDDDHLAVLIADVSEKGVPASLFMMASKIMIGYRTKLGGSPREILEAANEEIFLHNASRMFITVWIGILDIRTGHMVCSNAGHEYPEIRGQDGQFHTLKDEHGLVMGIKSGMRYTDYELILKPGDAVFVYTDGVTDAKNRQGEFYGDARIGAVLNEKPLEKAEDIIGAIREDMERFTEGAEQFDDITMLALIYCGNGGQTAEAEDPAGN